MCFFVFLGKVAGVAVVLAALIMGKATLLHDGTCVGKEGELGGEGLGALGEVGGVGGNCVRTGEGGGEGDGDRGDETNDRFFEKSMRMAV